MKKLLKNKKGFTLVEMLIVVAIIVILVVISVPVFSTNLNEARTATDEANMRAAKNAAVVYEIQTDITTTAVYYDAATGTIVTAKPQKGYGQASAQAGHVIEIKDNGSGTLTYSWVEIK